MQLPSSWQILLSELSHIVPAQRDCMGNFESDLLQLEQPEHTSLRDWKKENIKHLETTNRKQHPHFTNNKIFSHIFCDIFRLYEIYLKLLFLLAYLLLSELTFSIAPVWVNPKVVQTLYLSKICCYVPVMYFMSSSRPLFFSLMVEFTFATAFKCNQF